MRVVGGGGIVSVDVRRSGHHRWDRERDCGQAGEQNPRRSRLMPTAERCGQSCTKGNRAEQGTRGVGELRCLGCFETVDPRNASDTSGDPTRNGNRIDANNRKGNQTMGSGERREPNSELEHCDHHEHAGGLRVLGMDADGPCVDHPCSDGRDSGHCQTGKSANAALVGARRSRVTIEVGRLRFARHHNAPCSPRTLW
jgi:hypothetical protein